MPSHSTSSAIDFESVSSHPLVCVGLLLCSAERRGQQLNKEFSKFVQIEDLNRTNKSDSACTDREQSTRWMVGLEPSLTSDYYSDCRVRKLVMARHSEDLYPPNGGASVSECTWSG